MITQLGLKPHSVEESLRDNADSLLSWGADLVYREISDLSHTYPREENVRIIEWFDPRLAVDYPGVAN